MDGMIASAKKDVLVEIVKLAQKREMKGNQGGWKDFLKFYDKKFGSSLSDPAKRSADVLAAFLKTFSQKEDLKIFEKVLQCHSNRDAVLEFQKSSADTESPEQRLVRLTLENPQYPVDYSFPSHEEGWLITKRSKKSKVMQSTEMLAVDCEMALCDDGTEALIRVCAVDRNLKVKLDEFVKPSKAIVDYRTDITGITATDLDGVTCSLADVQRSLKKLLSHGKILVGHSLYNDLRALQIDHPRVIDTAYVFKYRDEPPNRRPSLSNLCKFVLGFELRKKGSPHNCLDDACAAMKLAIEKVEHDVDNVIPFVREKVQEEVQMAKLLVHRVPVVVSSEDLHKVISGEFTVEVKTNKKPRGDRYSAFAIFENQQAATEAFEKLDGILEKDTSGRPQKLVSFELDTGVSGSLCVCKMARHDSCKSNNASTKRPLQDEEPLGESKKSRTDHQGEELEKTNTTATSDQCETHLKEIERLKRELSQRDQEIANLKEIELLKRELSQRDQEIANLNKIVVALTRKQGL
ncbi:small RNA degrading nuclease 1-like [Ipomoea triloba]|uniref:small RNA degrading nuclease 1-like n=1 Tax=Ipomoea triloba TaxID=35885 RepID=UPI00125E3D08|nr:small RNA degrading nuclease 1-like [Ipomoea triloba]